jgi:molybdopterin synthase sulfur carrier subunit
MFFLSIIDQNSLHLIIVNIETMAVKVLIPTPLQKYTENQATIFCAGSNVRELIEELENAYPGIKKGLCDEQGEPRRFLNFYVNSEDIRFLEGTNTPLNDKDEVSIVPAVAGG